MNQMLQDAPASQQSQVDTLPMRRVATVRRCRRIRALPSRSGSPSCSPPGIARWSRNAASPSSPRSRRAASRAPQVDLFEVPGSFEIPLHAQLLAKTRRYTAIVAAGSWSTAASTATNSSPTP